MKTNIPGLIVTIIIAFNIFCLLLYFFLKFRKHDRKIAEDEEYNGD